jgi:hypothetical protein
VRRRWVLLLAFVWIGIASIAPSLELNAPAEPAAPERAHSGAVGFDVSFPQCPKTEPPPGEFGIVGLSNGRPFTVNPCALRLYTWAAELGTPAIYVNVAFSPSYARHVTASCEAAAPAGLERTRIRLAWAAGCSEASYALAHAPGPAARWWLDIETANSWSRNSTLNRIAIEAAAATLRRLAGRPVGVYSSARSWWLITGPERWNPPSATADWLAVSAHRTRATAPRACGRSFSGMPVALVQFYAPLPSGGVFDSNYVC